MNCLLRRFRLIAQRIRRFIVKNDTSAGDFLQPRPAKTLRLATRTRLPKLQPMKMVNLILAVWFSTILGLCAQSAAVSVELTLDQDQFLPDEDVRVAVKITNLSGQTLHFGTDPDWLSFSMESRNNQLVQKTGEPAVEGEFSLESSLTATKRVNITPCFDFARPGAYRIVATVRIPQWNNEIMSKPKSFEVVGGTRLREIEFGVPNESGDGRTPEIRRYVLQQALYLKQMRLYLRITDASGAKTLKLLPLAPMTSFSKPEAQLDKFSNLHVLTQSGARSFHYLVLNPDGQLLTRQTHDYTDTRPVLKYNAEGRVRVFGGNRRVTSSDIPAPQEPSSEPNVKTDAQ